MGLVFSKDMIKPQIVAEPFRILWKLSKKLSWGMSRHVGDSRWWGSLTMVRLEIRLNAFRRSTIPQKQFIIITIIIIMGHDWCGFCRQIYYLSWASVKTSYQFTVKAEKRIFWNSGGTHPLCWRSRLRNEISIQWRTDWSLIICEDSLIHRVPLTVGNHQFTFLIG